MRPWRGLHGFRAEPEHVPTALSEPSRGIITRRPNTTPTGATAVGRYVAQREAMMLSEPSKCWYAEPLTVEFVRRSNLSVAFSHVRLVRLRGDLRTPDVDNASVIGGTPPRSWMRTIHRFSEALRCVPWDKTHALPAEAPSSSSGSGGGGGGGGSGGSSRRMRGAVHHRATTTTSTNRSATAFVTVVNRRCSVK